MKWHENHSMIGKRISWVVYGARYYGTVEKVAASDGLLFETGDYNVRLESDPSRTVTVTPRHATEEA